MKYNHGTVRKDVLKSKNATAYATMIRSFCIPLDAMMRFMGAEKLIKNAAYIII